MLFAKKISYTILLSDDISLFHLKTLENTFCRIYSRRHLMVITETGPVFLIIMRILYSILFIYVYTDSKSTAADSL